ARWLRSAIPSGSTSCGCGETPAPEREPIAVMSVHTDERSQQVASMLRRAQRWRRIVLLLALLLLNASLSFHNIWPTPAVAWAGELSVEFAVCIALLALTRHLLGRSSKLVRRALAALWVLLVIGRYADVTAPALYGREIN